MTLPSTVPYVDRIIRIFRDRPHDDTSALVLHDYATAAIAALPTPAPGALPELIESRLRYLERFSDEGRHKSIPGPYAGPAWELAQDLRMAIPAYARAYAEQCRAGVDRSKEVFSFESWAIAQGFHPDDFDRIEGRPANKFGLTWEYNGNFLQASWAAWMERAALQSAFADDEGVR